MHKIARRLRPATRGAAIFHGRIHHVNGFQYPSRAAFRCTHSGSNGETGGTVNGNETSLEENRDGSGGLDGVGFSGEKAQKKGEEEVVSAVPEVEQHEVDIAEKEQPHLTETGGIIRKVLHLPHDDTLAQQNSPKKQKSNIIRKVGARAISPREAARIQQRISKGAVEWSDVIKPLSKPTKREPAIDRARDRIEQEKKDPPYHIMTRSCTLECEFPEQTTKEDLLTALRSVKFTAKNQDLWAKKVGRQAVVLLFTPSFAALVENDVTFVPDVLKALTKNSPRANEESKAKEELLEIDVVCACVDGLAPGPEMLPISVGRRPKEGFSILHGPECNSIYPLWNENEIPPSRSPSMQSSITLRKGLTGASDLTLPLANTLFKTGRLSTLLVSRWEYKPSRDIFFAIKHPVERTNAIINIFQDVVQQLPKSFIPAVALTPARPIVSGLGNIVRTIDFGGEEGIGPASRELESTVTKYLDTMGYGNTTIDVWALVIPPSSVSTKAEPGSHMQARRSLTAAVDEVQSKWMATDNLSRESSFVGSWIPKGNAKFCRVLSGGGGWGAKQGLLSLDPQTTYSEIPEARFDFSGGSLEEQQTSALGNIAQEGAYIQFFVARRNTLKEMPVYDRSAYKVLMRQSAVFGAVPSTVDDVPTPPREINKESTDTPTPPFIIRRGHFGLVSEAGMFVRHGPHHKPGQPPMPDSFTKVDMPYSYFYIDYKSSKELEKEPSIRMVHAAKRDLFRRVVMQRSTVHPLA
ncbi:hypothetical protein DL98DRAFT_236536 [Cadophora sp. DSE1049]|nr:hypothetical protein DL98DRAFT_236536 [Cadophora sp. DSE1049]